jgi:pectinesterase
MYAMSLAILGICVAGVILKESPMKLNRVMSYAILAMLLLCGANELFGKDVTVDASGAGDFKTVQAAIDSVPSKNSERVRILIKPGTYEEQLQVPKDKPMVSLIGQGGKPEETVLTFHLKASDPKADGSGNVGTTGSASATINGNDFVAENLTFANSAGDNVGQAVAVKTNGDRLVFRNCRFTSFQDTLYPSGKGRCYFKDCYITGDTDFIFGNATAVFDHCTINSSDAGFITAANTTPQQAAGFVFLDCTLTASDAAATKPASVWLGRPWQWDRGSKASVVFIRTKMGPHINPKGWHPWDQEKNTDPGSVTSYGEFGSTDAEGKPLDVSQRVTWAYPIAEGDVAKYTIEKVLSGDDHWDPMTAGK